MHLTSACLFHGAGSVIVSLVGCVWHTRGEQLPLGPPGSCAGPAEHQLGGTDDLLIPRAQSGFSRLHRRDAAGPGPSHLRIPYTECTEKLHFICFSFSLFPDLMCCIIQKTIQMGKTLALKQEAGERKKETQHTPFPSSPSPWGGTVLPKLCSTQALELTLWGTSRGPGGSGLSPGLSAHLSPPPLLRSRSEQDIHRSPQSQPAMFDEVSRTDCTDST